MNKWAVANTIMDSCVALPKYIFLRDEGLSAFWEGPYFINAR